ncbi:MAG: TonB-dependent receptor [Alistipes sp.]|nr:TonB-dependent receptor [Alistipes sp.]
MVRKLVLSLVAVLSVVAFAIAQNKQVSGTVVGGDGQPIAGATVIVAGTTTGTTTGASGEFTVSAPANGSLQVSFIGYQTETVAIAGKTSIKVTLHEDTQAIDDVIVVAFGTAKKEAFTGSAKVIKSDDIAKTQSSNLTDALVGKVAGVQFTSASGRLGAGQTVTIRGTGSINAGNSPLYVVDGVPYEGNINNINSADIESMTILKDAASNALYGARGANGVIMITTKKAKVGDAVVTFEGKWGVNTRALQNYDVTDEAGEYYEFHHRALMNYRTLENKWSEADAYAWASQTLTSSDAGGLAYNVFTVPEGQNLIGTNGKLNPLATEGRLVNYKGQDFWLKPDNWLDEIYGSSFRQEYNVSVAGATDRSNFYASAGYLDNTGVIEGSNMERITARLRADYQAKKWLRVGGNFSYTHFDWNNGFNNEGASDGGNAFATALRMAPIYPLYMRDGDGNIMIDEHGFQMYDFGDGRNGGAMRRQAGMENDLQNLTLNKNNSEGNAFTASGFADFYLYDGLKLTVNGNVTIDETRSTELMNPYYGQFAVSGGVLYKGHSRSIAQNFQQLLSYTKDFGQHSVDVLVGHESYNLKSYSIGATKSGMFAPDYLELSGMVTDMSSSSSGKAEYNNEGYFFRAMYDYADKYYFSGSYRRDASSRFHPDNRWGSFWSLGASWIISKENWFGADWVNLLKVKASYGSQGNDNIGSYYYVDYYSIENDGQGGVTTVLSRKGNKDITWETNGNLNVGVEFGFWGDRLYGNVDFFNRKTTDMLFSLAVPVEAGGYSSIMTNIGDMSNRGFEIEIGGDIIRTKDFVWSANLNMTHYKNEVTKLPDQYKDTPTSDGKHMGRINGGFFLAEGMSYYEIYRPSYAGVNQETGESQWYYWEERNKLDADNNPIQKVDPETGELMFDENNKPIYETEMVRDITADYSKASTNGRELQGCALPDLFGGFGTTLQWKGLDFSAQFTYQIGGQAYDSGYAIYMSSPTGLSDGSPYHRDLLNAWTPENKESNIPRFAYGDNYSSSNSDRFLTDASYLNIQNITLGYTLPQKWTKKFMVNKFRIYVSCDNVWYWSKRQGLDPRQSISGATSPYYHAPVRTFTGGVSVTF